MCARTNTCNIIGIFVLGIRPEVPETGTEADYSVYEGESISNQSISFHALFQYMFYMWVHNCMLIELLFDKILNVKHG